MGISAELDKQRTINKNMHYKVLNMENLENNIFGCFVSSIIGDNNGDFFRSYIWGERGISDTLKRLNHKDYGNDLKLILFQFNVSPGEYKLQFLKEIESYHKKEKAIGIPIIVTDENFFSKTEEERYRFLKESIFQKLDLLAEVVKKKKLDTNMKQLKIDLEKTLK